MFIKELSVTYRKKRVPKTAHCSIGKKVTSSRAIYELFKDIWKECSEKFYVLHMNNKNVIQSIQLVSVGSLTASIVEPREVFKAALIAGSAAIAFVHNHPSGDPKPSDEDVEITKRLKEVGSIVGIKVIDHIVIGDGEFFSLKDNGLM
ncbi:MAG: JAB domain-containing protein [Candidatus Anammoxibacter sp.]